MNKALIITPTGRPLYFHEDYVKDEHWRYTKADRKSTRLNSSHSQQSRMPSSA